MQGSKITESTVHPRDCFHRDANELLMAQADKYDYDYLKSLIRMPNGKRLHEDGIGSRTICFMRRKAADCRAIPT